MTMLRAIAVAAVAGSVLWAPHFAAAQAAFSDTDVRAIQSFTKRMLERAKTGSSTTWRNGDGSIGGRVTITTTDHQPGAQPCRTYEWTMRRQGGAEMTGIGRGCRTGAGEWDLEETRSERQSSIDPPPQPLTVRPPEREEAKPAEKAQTRSASPAKAPKPATTAEIEPSPPPKTVAPPEAPKTPAERLAELEFTPPPRVLTREPKAEGAE